MERKIFRASALYEMRTEWEKFAGFDACLVVAQESGQWFRLVCVAEPSPIGDQSTVLRRTARILRTVESVHIIKAYDFGSDDDGLFVILENIEGQPLPAWLERQEQVEEFRALRFLYQLALLLKDLQYYGETHGNLRPESILLSPDSSRRGEEILRVWDLILSVSLEHAHAYQAPEFFREKPTDVRSDIYSVGAIVYRLLAGRLPFVANNAGKLVLNIMGADEPTPLGSIRTDLSKECVQLVGRCLAKNPADRFGSANELVSAVESLVGKRKDAGEHLMHLAQVSARRNDWEEVLRLAKTAAAIPGAGRRFVLLEREACKRLEEEAIEDAERTLRKVEGLLRRDRNGEALEEVLEAQKRLAQSVYFQQSKHKPQLAERLELAVTKIKQRLRFQPAYVESLATGAVYALEAPQVAIGRGLQPAGRVDFVSLAGEPEAKTVSKQEQVHFHFADGAWTLNKGEETVNKTLVNARELAPHSTVVLNEDDEIMLGNVRLRFRLRQEGGEANGG